MATRNGNAEWKGDLKGGSGDLTVGNGVFSGQYSFSSRFEEGEGTNPEELIAAGHAACFSMALANILAEAGPGPAAPGAPAPGPAPRPPAPPRPGPATAPSPCGPRRRSTCASATRAPPSPASTSRRSA